jgi:cytochrome c556
MILLIGLVSAIGCQRKSAEAPIAPPFMPDATIKDLMINVVDTSADVVWLSVTAVQDERGLTEIRPRNDEDWNRVRSGAITLAEAANLLMIPGRHVAREGEKSETPGVELEPQEMEVLINQDRDSWNERAKALHAAALSALDAADAHDADRIFEVGEQIENACENCHKQYWYPNEKLPQ